MGVTYKAFDINLHCPVTLKVISERYLGDESARLRFLREARAAASVRHPNVASVFHLGRTGSSYFYAMEFVEGETLQSLIKRTGRLDVKLALEIATHVAAGLAAVHEQNLVHRDIKPSNIMVRLKDEGSIKAKIIDLGLAKAISEPSLQTAISTPGGFVGTPEFASPEQFAGLALDTRSDLYSLGVTLWVMVTAQTPFRGPSAEVMYQHQHAPLPFEELGDVPQPVLVLLEKLLHKDPAQRFRTPDELLKAMPTISGAVDAGRRIARQSLQKTPFTGSRVGIRKAPAKPGPEKISVAKLPVTGSDVFGREEDIAFLDRAWANKDINVVSIVAWAGVGKSTLVNHWLRRMAADHYRSADLVFGWSFYRQGTSGQSSSADEFLDFALSWFGDPDPRIGTACLTESLTDLRPTEWQTILAKLRRARLLAREDPHNPGQLDTHPLVREYFGEQLRSQQTDAWKECNRRLFHYYRTFPPQLPDNFREMEPLFFAVICGCNAGLFREALREVYIPRIQRGDAHFAANVLGARGALLSVLAHFFDHGRWRSPLETGTGEHSLTREDQLFILMQAAAYLATRGTGSLEARICYEHAESLCHSLNDLRLLYVTLIGQWRYALVTYKLSAAVQIAERVHLLAQKQDDPTVMIWACNGLACTLYFLGNFEASRLHAVHGVRIWSSGGGQSHPEDVDTPVVGCLCHGALSEWHLGEIASCQAKLNEAISLAKELKDMHAFAIALNLAAALAANERNPAEVDRLASDLIELSTRHNFLHFLAAGGIWRGRSRSVSGDTAEGIRWIEQGIRDYRATGAVLGMPSQLARKAEALYLADRTCEALEAINEAEALAERFENRYWCAELHRLRGVFLAGYERRRSPN